MKGKIIQIIQNEEGYLTVLTDEGKIFARIPFTRLIKNGKDEYKEETDWETGMEWIEITTENTRSEYKKPQSLPF